MSVELREFKETTGGKLGRKEKDLNAKRLFVGDSGERSIGHFVSIYIFVYLLKEKKREKGPFGKLARYVLRKKIWRAGTKEVGRS